MKACVFRNRVLKITLIIWEDGDRMYVRKPFQVIIRCCGAIEDIEDNIEDRDPSYRKDDLLNVSNGWLPFADGFFIS